MIILALAAIEFGNYFVKREIVSSAISNVSQTLQRDPAHIFTTQEINSMGGGYVSFNNGKNFICADAYQTPAQAANSTANCTANKFNTTNPFGVNSTNAYYVSVRSSVGDAAITPLGKFIPAVNTIKLASSSGSTEVGYMIPPNNCGTLPLVYSGGSYHCANIPTNCGTNQSLNYVNGAFTCTASVPTCNPPNILGWNGSSYTCTGVPTCDSGQSLTFNGGQYQCTTSSSFSKVTYYYRGATTDGGGGGQDFIGNHKLCVLSSMYIKQSDYGAKLNCGLSGGNGGYSDVDDWPVPNQAFALPNNSVFNISNMPTVPWVFDSFGRGRGASTSCAAFCFD